ncbi:hypothetical protein DFH09DRAFT_1216430 [Mycena vulgaris]|nr:hypothetical protein DFH09DRAFT_1216430 [Mycena vulgaris]
MARGNKKGISDETKRHKQEDIARDLRICLSSVEKILARYRKESEGLHVPTLRVRGLPRALGAADIDFLVGLIQRTPDMYLHEMQAQLREVCNVDVVRRGYTRKRVSDQ